MQTTELAEKYPCVKVSGFNWTIYCCYYTTQAKNLAAAKRAVIALLDESDDYFETDRFKLDGTIQFYYTRGSGE